MKDHLISQFVNNLTDIARKFATTQQLRERISQLVVSQLKEPQPDTVDWAHAEAVCNLPDVDEAIRNLIEDHTGDNATFLVRAVLQARIHQ